jgi:phage terminase large subunit
MIVRTDKAIFFDYNPDMPHFVEEIFLKGGRTDVDFLTLTYKSNELIPKGELQTILDRIELSKQPNAPENIKNWTRIFAYGEMGTYSDRMIYSYQFCDKIPDTAKQLNSGMDFAQSPDQTVLVDMYLDGVNLYVDERFALNNLAAEKIDGSERMSVVDQMDLIEFPKGRMIIGDTSGRLSILDMRNHGYNILAVKKNLPVYEGINKVKAYNLFITKRSVSLKKGIENWFWKVDANSKIIPEPQGHEPDGLAALRYAMLYYSQ